MLIAFVLTSLLVWDVPEQIFVAPVFVVAFSALRIIIMCCCWFSFVLIALVLATLLVWDVPEQNFGVVAGFLLLFSLFLVLFFLAVVFLLC